jgi:CTP:molybdopterin cytidylyltransferase MocA
MNTSPPGNEGAVVVLLAAGEGRRFGALKQLAQVDGEPMVRRVARTLLHLCRPLLVVTGAGGDVVAGALAGLAATCVPNPGWRDGMGASLGIGIRAVRDRCPKATAALVCLADHPLLEARGLQAMLDRHAQAPARIIASDHAGMPGPPVLFPADCFSELAAWQGAEGARAWLRGQGTRVEHLPLDVTDVDTPADLLQVERQLATSNGRVNPR